MINFRQTLQATLFTVLVLLFNIGLPMLLLKPPENSFQVTELRNKNEGSTFQLPFSKLIKFKNSDEQVAGSIVYDEPLDTLPTNFFVPAFNGRLVVMYKNKIIYDHFSSFENTRVSRKLSSVNFPLPEKADPNDLKVFHSSALGLFSLSNIYLGDEKSIAKAASRYKFFSIDVKIGLFICEALMLFSCVLLVLTGNTRSDILPIIAILIFMVVNSSINFVSFFPDIALFYPYSLSLWPLMFFGVILLQVDLQRSVLTPAPPVEKKWLWCVILLFLSVSFQALNIIPVPIQHLLISAPMILLGAMWAAWKSLSRFVRLGEIKSGFFGICIFILMGSTFNDLFFMLGFHQNSISLSSMSGFTFVFFVLVQSSIRVLELTDFLEKNSIVMVAKLKLQALQLKEKYDEELLLEGKRRSILESERIGLELHDGVMGYLSMIKALSENAARKPLSTIFQMASQATEEVRMIFSMRYAHNPNIMVFLATFRSRILEPLESMGVAVTMDLEDLKSFDENYSPPSTDLIRIMQEAVHNAVQRAKCKELRIKVSPRGDSLLVFRFENTGGKTFDNRTSKSQGFVLESMKSRVNKLGGTFNIEPISGGAVLVFTIDIKSAILRSAI